jgi:NADH-quinone oxidoreductase subunit E
MIADQDVIAARKALESIYARYSSGAREQLIPILQEAQHRLGFLSQDTMCDIGQHLGLPASKVYGVATFYNQFRFQPQGKCHCQVCCGTACHVKGGARVLQAITGDLQVQPGETTRDGNFSVEVVACLGACGLAPVVTMNGEFHAGMTADGIRKLVRVETKRIEAGDGQRT